MDILKTGKKVFLSGKQLFRELSQIMHFRPTLYFCFLCTKTHILIGTFQSKWCRTTEAKKQSSYIQGHFTWWLSWVLVHIFAGVWAYLLGFNVGMLSLTRYQLCYDLGACYFMSTLIENKILITVKFLRSSFLYGWSNSYPYYLWSYFQTLVLLTIGRKLLNFLFVQLVLMLPSYRVLLTGASYNK